MKHSSYDMSWMLYIYVLHIHKVLSLLHKFSFVLILYILPILQFARNGIIGNFSLVFYFQCRGWGKDLASPQLNELYEKQRELQEQAKKRDSLAALSLAFATPR